MLYYGFEAPSTTKKEKMKKENKEKKVVEQNMKKIRSQKDIRYKEKDHAIW